jgi:hypothetical protein
MDTNYYLEYAKHMNCADDVFCWIKNVLSKNITENSQSEIEHILDYMASQERPLRISKMSFEQAKSNTKKWNKTLQKKGKNISELEGIDFKTIIDFQDGFKIIQLISENAYKKEGFLMRHCVASYFGKNTEIYSLRDNNNMPHCTIEKNQQVKGKGNGEINEKYIDYIVQFLISKDFTVSDNEMLNLGYVNIEKLVDLINDNYVLFQNKYIKKSNLFNLKNKKNETFFSQDFDLIFDNKFIFDLTKIKEYVDGFIDNIQNASSGNRTKNASSGDNTQNASIWNTTHNASIWNTTQNASSGEYTKNASSGDNTQNASSGDYTQNASSGEYTQNASSGNRTKNASSGDNTQNASSGNRTKNASSGNRTKNASSGNRTKNASSGKATQNASSGDNTQNASSGEYTKNASSGEYTKNASSGDYTQNASSGNATQNASSGDYTQNASSGNRTKNASSGNKTQNASSGDRTITYCYGKNSITADIGRNSMGGGVIGTYITLAEYNNEGNVICVKSEKIDGVNLKEGVLYKLENFYFQECLDVPLPETNLQ